jgi:hypothetical protein
MRFLGPSVNGSPKTITVSFLSLSRIGSRGRPEFWKVGDFAPTKVSLPIRITRVIFPYNFVIFEQRNRASIRFGLRVFRPNDEQSELAHTFPHGYAFVNHSNSPNDYSECGTGFSHLKASERFGAVQGVCRRCLSYLLRGRQKRRLEKWMRRQSGTHPMECLGTPNTGPLALWTCSQAVVSKIITPAGVSN